MSSSTGARVTGHLSGKPNLVFGKNYGEDVDPSRWVVIYPPYIDSTRKQDEVWYSRMRNLTCLRSQAASDIDLLKSSGCDAMI